MWIECQLAFRSYLPQQIGKGQMFLIKQDTGKFAYPEIVMYDGVTNPETWVANNGWPVELYIVDPGDAHKDVEYVLATPEQIGWMDEGEHTDELCDIELKHINKILKEYDSWVVIEAEEDDTNEYYPYKAVLRMNKVLIRYVNEDLYEWEEEEEDDEDIPLEN